MELLSLPLHAYVVLDALYDDKLIDEGTYLVIMARMTHGESAFLFDGLETYELRRADTRMASVPGKREFGARLNAMADAAIASFGDDERRSIAALRVRWLRRQASDLAWFFAITSFEDQTTGGALEPWLPKVRLHRDGRPFRKVWAKLHSPEFMRQKVVAERESSDFAADAARIMKDAPDGPVDEDLIARWRQRIEEERRIARDANERAFWLVRGMDPLAAFRLSPRQIAKQRRVIKRAVKTALRVLPATDVSRFVKGDSIRLEGHALDLIVERGGSLAGIGAHQLEITLAERGGKRLADLCLYIDETPALDQLTGLALAMAAGDEHDVVRDANVIRVYPAGEQHPLLLGRTRARVAAIRDADPVIDFKNRYVERTKPRWARELIRFASVERLEFAA